MNLKTIGTINLEKEMKKEQDKEIRFRYEKHRVAEYKKKHPNEIIIETEEDIRKATVAARNNIIFHDEPWEVPFRVVCPCCCVMGIQTLQDAQITIETGCSNCREIPEFTGN